MFLPNALPTRESWRTTSLAPSVFRRVLAQSPIGTITASWFILKLLLAREVQAALPRVAEAVGPLAGKAVALVPDVLFRPQPALLAHRDDQLEDVGVALAVDHLFLDVDHQRAGGLEHARELLGARHEPVDVVVGRDAAVGRRALVGVRRRGDDQVDALAPAASAARRGNRPRPRRRAPRVAEGRWSARAFISALGRCRWKSVACCSACAACSSVPSAK